MIMTVVYGPRERVETDSFKPEYVSCPWERWMYGKPYLYGNTNTIVPKNTQTRYCKDVVTQRFKERQARGEIFNNPFLSEKVTENTGGAPHYKSIYLLNKQYGAEGYIYDGKVAVAPYMPEYLALEPDPTNSKYWATYDKAVTQAWGNRSVVAFAASMALAEGKKTIQGIYEILFRVVQIAKAAKRLDYKYLLDELSPSELKDRYMELRYAIRPLVIDASNIIKTVNAQRGNERRTARGGHSLRSVVSDTTTSWVGQQRFTWSRTAAHIVEARAGVLCDVNVSSPGLLGMNEINETLLEVFPFSFILGWFVDVASLISSWTPKYGIWELASWVTVKETMTQQVTMTDASYPNDFPSGLTGEKYLSWSGTKTKTVVRTTRTPNPKRSIWPSCDVNLDTLKIIDLGIILTSILTGTAKKWWR
jgi:hypothetical protein